MTNHYITSNKCTKGLALMESILKCWSKTLRHKKIAAKEIDRHFYHPQKDQPNTKKSYTILQKLLFK
jgi:hypothetical protein